MKINYTNRFVFFLFAIPAIFSLFKIGEVLLYDLPQFVEGQNAEIVLYDSIRIVMNSNFKARTYYAYGKPKDSSRLSCTTVSTFAYYSNLSFETMRDSIQREGLRWKTYFKKNGSSVVFKNDTEKEIRRVMYNMCYLYLMGFIPIVFLIILRQLIKLFY